MSRYRENLRDGKTKEKGRSNAESQGLDHIKLVFLKPQTFNGTRGI